MVRRPSTSGQTGIPIEKRPEQPRWLLDYSVVPAGKPMRHDETRIMEHTPFCGFWLLQSISDTIRSRIPSVAEIRVKSRVVFLVSLFIAQGTLPSTCRVDFCRVLRRVNAEKYCADAKTGRARREGRRSPHIPASLTKIMTLYILFDEISAGR